MEIRIRGEIPETLRRRKTIKASEVGGAGDDAVELTAFLNSQVIEKLDEEWRVELPAESGQVANELALKRLVEDAGLGLMLMGADNQFNMKVNIRDPAGNTVHFASRVDAILLANKALADEKNDAVVNILEHAIAVIEIESGGKGMPNAQIQLLASMRAIAASTGKQHLYGIVIDRCMCKARLLKLFGGCFSADGYFHPSQLGVVGDMLMRTRP